MRRRRRSFSDGVYRGLLPGHCAARLPGCEKFCLRKLAVGEGEPLCMKRLVAQGQGHLHESAEMFRCAPQADGARGMAPGKRRRCALFEVFHDARAVVQLAAEPQRLRSGNVRLIAVPILKSQSRLV